MKNASKLLIASLLALLLVASLAAFGNRQLDLSRSSGSTFSAYPLPGTPTPKAPAGVPTRAAYPLPGAGGPAPKPRAPGAPLTFTAVSTSFLPIVYKAVGYKGTAGIITSRSDLGYTNELTMGVQWGYDWGTIFSTTNDVYSTTFPYEIVNHVSSTYTTSTNPTTTVYITWNIGLNGCPGAGWHDSTPGGQAALRACVADVAAAHPGRDWMIWNEPDLGAENSKGQDHISPTLAAQYFKEISDTILGADPTALLIVGNVGSEYGAHPLIDCFPHPDGCGVYWLTQFVFAYTMTYGIDPRPAIAGYGIHAYSNANAAGLGLSGCAYTDDACLYSHFTAFVQAGIDWVNANDPGSELWVTETNWESTNEFRDNWDLQTTRMISNCSFLAAQPVQRYGWYTGVRPDIPKEITVSLFAADLSVSATQVYSGVLSPAGQTFIGC